MKLFGVFAHVELTDQPAWLGPFRAKYDEPYEPHITLKQLTWVEDQEVAGVKRIMTEVMHEFVSPQHEIRLAFNELVLDPADPANPLTGNTIMLKTSQASTLVELQHRLRSAFSRFGTFDKPHAQSYEENFVPHQTIARHISDEQFVQAQKELPAGASLTGVVRQVVLKIMDRPGAEAANDPSGHTVFQF